LHNATGKGDFLHEISGMQNPNGLRKEPSGSLPAKFQLLDDQAVKIVRGELSIPLKPRRGLVEGARLPPKSTSSTFMSAMRRGNIKICLKD